jgi:hypothetical protein
MVRRLLEVHYLANRSQPSAGHVDFWLRELRTPVLLIEAASRYPTRATELATERPALVPAHAGDEPSVAAALAGEERRERDADRRYWEPLRRELEALRRSRA